MATSASNRGTLSRHPGRFQVTTVVSDEADTARINRTIEGYVRKHPEQYLWVHKRFKHQPPGQDHPYR